MTDYLTYNLTTGTVTGLGHTPDHTLPDGAIPCTAAELADYAHYRVDITVTPPVLVYAPPSSAALLADAQRAKLQSLSAACRAQIEAGFDSVALGATHHYPAGAQDQANLTASVTASLIPNLPTTWTTPFWSRDAAGNWAYADHTAAQIQQAGQDGKSAVTAALQKNANLAHQVMAIGTEPGWTAGATIAGGAIIQSGGRRYQSSSAGGATGGTAPVWPTATGATVTDGTVTWTDLGTLVEGVQAIVW